MKLRDRISCNLFQNILLVSSPTGDKMRWTDKVLSHTKLCNENEIRWRISGIKLTRKEEDRRKRMKIFVSRMMSLILMLLWFWTSCDNGQESHHQGWRLKWKQKRKQNPNENKQSNYLISRIKIEICTWLKYIWSLWINKNTLK